MPRIVDQYGRPIRTGDLATPQTERDDSPATLGLHREFGGHPSRGLTPVRLADILGRAEQTDLTGQADLAEDMEEKDAHLFAELSKRKRSLLGLGWEIVPPRNPSAREKKAAMRLQEQIEDIDDFEDAIFDLADGILKGYSNLEIQWQRSGADWHPARLHHRPARWFTVLPDRRDEIRLRDGSRDGAQLQPFGWLQHVHKAKSGYVTRGGLCRVLAWPYLFKNYSIRDLAEFLEIYGLPLRLGLYPPGANAEQKATLLDAVVSIGHDAAGIIPEGMALEFKEAAKGSSDPFQAMIAWCERSESKAIVGQTLSAEAASTGLGSGVADFQSDVMADLIISDARQVGGTLSRDLVFPLHQLNIGGDPTRAPRFRFDTSEPEDLKARADRDKILFDMGLRLKPEAAREVYGDDYEPIPRMAPAPSPGNEESDVDSLTALAQREALAAAAQTRSPAAPADRDLVDDFADRLEREAGPVMDRLLEPVQRLVDNAESLQEILEGLVALYPDMDETAFAALLRDALAAAELAGQVAVQEGE